ncbi:MAG: PP2C family serine/threonine-protein phosphatase [Pseudomonadota bacterium]
MQYSIAQQSHQGGRDYNEDRTAIYEREGAMLLVVADGLGGHAGGELASQAFVDAMGDSFTRATVRQLDDAGNFLKLSINYAHHKIHRRAANHGYDPKTPKTTCVVCLVQGDQATWAHSGDSRLYLINKRKIEAQTEDHVSVKHGRFGNNPINRCVGGAEPPMPEISETYVLGEKDVLVLASDGAWQSFKPDDIDEYIDNEHPTLGLDNLLQELENRNKAPSDNLSMTIMFWGVNQMDHPSATHYEESDSIQILNHVDYDQPASGDKKNAFDMKDLDDKINEIEEFISDVDKQI